MKYLLKLFSLIALSAVLLLGFDIWQNYSINSELSESKKFELLWKQDVNKLRKTKKWKSLWRQLKLVEVFPSDKKAKKWMKKIRPPVAPQNPKAGKLKLEVLIMSWKTGGKRGAIVQYNFIDLKSNNMFLEVGRTFTFN